MLATKSLLVASLLAVARAHFQLQFPQPRGAFVEDDEPKFCDGYDNAASNRTVFPLSGGFFSINSEHPSWTAGVSLSTKAEPTTFQDFSTIVPFFRATGEGIACLNLDLSKTNASVTDGQNVTLEIVFDGGDGQLFQCADLTLSSTAKISSDITCKNGTSTGGDDDSSSASAASGSGSATSPAPAASSTAPNSALSLGSEGAYMGSLLPLLGFGLAAVFV